jgi:hypothetical protein
MSFALCASAGAATGYEQKTETVTVMAGQSFGAVTASCSAGNRVVGGGFDVSDASVLTVASSAPDSDHSWTVSVISTGASPQVVTATAVCLPGSAISGYEQRTTTAPVGRFGEVSVACSPGNKIVAGGFSVQDPTVMNISSSEPVANFSLSDHNWEIFVDNHGSVSNQATVTGICVSSSSVSGYEQQFIHTAVGFGPSTVSTTCSAGKEVLGGGFLVELTSVMPLTSAQPASSGTWSFSVTNTGAAARVVEAGGICITPVTVDDDLALGAAPDITTDATGPSGAMVTYTLPVVVDEDVPPTASVSCAPDSGSMFAIGVNTVTCIATDADDANSPVSVSFAVTVKGAAGQLADLFIAVQGVGPGTSLADKVAAIQSAVAAGQAADACEELTAFVNEVRAQAGKKIPPLQGASLITDAKRIQAVLGCTG